MTTWDRMSWLLLDSETTSPQPAEARLVTATVVELDETRRATPHQWVINPGVPVPAEAAAIHGYTTERVQAEGVAPAGAVREIAERVVQAWDQHIPVLIYNAPFDLGVLTSEMTRHLGTALPDPPGPVLDPLVCDKACDRWRKGSRKLVDVAAHYQVAAGTAHEALSDALAAGRVMWRLARVFPELAAMTLSELQDYQANAYREHAQSLEKYRRRRMAEDGEPRTAIDAVHIPREWPLRQPSAQEVAA